MSDNERFINNVLHSDSFRLRVNEIVSDNSQWKEMVKNLQIENKIKDRVQSQVDLAKGDLQKLKNDIRAETEKSIPGQVSIQIANQMPKYLDQNSTMKELMKDHVSDMKEKLNKEARAILESIVNDPQYHMVHRVYFEAIDAKANYQLNDQRDSFIELQRESRTRVDNELQSIKTLQDDVRTLKSSLENQRSWQLFMGSSLCVTIGFVMYLLVKSP